MSSEEARDQSAPRPAPAPEPPRRPGCLGRLVAVAALLVSLFVILSPAGNAIPLGLDETAATLLLLWSSKVLFGVDLAPFLHRRGGRREARASDSAEA